MIDVSNTENQIHYVTNFEELVSTAFFGDVNAICWRRKLVGDFSEIIKKVKLNSNLVELNEEQLLKLELSEQGQLARELIPK